VLLEYYLAPTMNSSLYRSRTYVMRIVIFYFVFGSVLWVLSAVLHATRRRQEKENKRKVGRVAPWHVTTDVALVLVPY
jgi:flagellar biosynthesis/type III secretory pathway M-ring protein FliF/YscJ